MTWFVNGEEVKEEEILQEMGRMRSHYQQAFQNQTKEEQEAQLRDWARENIIERMVITQEARADQSPVEAEEIEKRFKELIKNHGGEKQFYKQFGLKPEDEPKILADIELQIKVERLLQKKSQTADEPTREDAQQFYQQNLEQFMTPEQVRAAHVVKHIDETRNKMQAYQEILEVQKRLSEGVEFETVADENSDCPGNGGDLGYFARGQMVQEFEDVVFALQVGQISDIIRSSYGYHIAKIYDRRSSQPVPFAEVEDQIIAHLKSERENKQNEDFIDSLKEKALIEERNEPLVKKINGAPA